MDAFKQQADRALSSRAPLADRMRPRTLDEFIGQEHIIGPGRLLRRAIQIDQLSSLIFYGPPGTGKTTLARIIANTTKAQFLSINAVLAGVKDIREAIDSARRTLELYGKRTILFIDEVHRFNKAQQDALLPHVESGLVILIGATTENPYFEVNKALVSRSRVFQLRSLGPEDLKRVARQALGDREHGYGNTDVVIDDDALEHLARVANGDARGVLNAIELAVETTQPDENGQVHIDRAVAEESIQQRAVLYDKDGDAHYDTISAFIKSLRGSDPDAALYWMAKMIYAGEDPRFVFRRMAIFACEDIGLADPDALRVVMSAAQAFDFVGMPEGRYHLAHACLYCATAPKSNSSMAFFDALGVVAKEMQDEVPSHLMDASRDGEGFGHGEGYLYPHAYRDHWVAQQYLPGSLQGKVFYQPSEQGFEKGIRERVLQRREAQLEAMVESDAEEALGSATSQATAGSWSRRTRSGRGDVLAGIRDRLFEMAGIDRDSLVLDLQARTGLLALSAARKVTHGAVWALTHDERADTTLRGMTRTLDELQRPQVIRVSWESFDSDVAEAAGAGVRFSAIVGRNVLGGRDDRRDIVKRAAGLLADDGVMALAETVPSMGARVSSLCDLSALPPEVAEAFAATEESLFSDPDDPRVNWNADSLERELSGVAGVDVSVRTVEEHAPRRISRSDIQHWFRKTTTDERPSLGSRLEQSLGMESVARIRDTLMAQLADREVRWRTVIAFVRVSVDRRLAV
ncbi:MAG: AAA family ATPase [Chitinivibrionales bacterium]|nr:AAA family ATPase [Chitinivibrionales bacterium]